MCRTYICIQPRAELIWWDWVDYELYICSRGLRWDMINDMHDIEMICIEMRCYRDSDWYKDALHGIFEKRLIMNAFEQDLRNIYTNVLFSGKIIRVLQRGVRSLRKERFWKELFLLTHSLCFSPLQVLDSLNSSWAYRGSFGFSDRFDICRAPRCK